MTPIIWPTQTHTYIKMIQGYKVSTLESPVNMNSHVTTHMINWASEKKHSQLAERFFLIGVVT